MRTNLIVLFLSLFVFSAQCSNHPKGLVFNILEGWIPNTWSNAIRPFFFLPGDMFAGLFFGFFNIDPNYPVFCFTEGFNVLVSTISLFNAY
jgi:hypothetical protein